MKSAENIRLYSSFSLIQTSEDEFESLYEIYADSFPLSEQKTKESLHTIIHRTDYAFFSLIHDDKPIGFTVFFCPADESFALLEYMAVADEFRGNGAGTMLLQHSLTTLIGQHGPKKILIEIDSPNEFSPDRDQRIRRETFYRRSGCRIIDGFDYILGLITPYSPPRMELMVFDPENNYISMEDLRQYIEMIYTSVYNRSADDPDIIKMFKKQNSRFNYR